MFGILRAQNQVSSCFFKNKIVKYSNAQLVGSDASIRQNLIKEKI